MRILLPKDIYTIEKPLRDKICELTEWQSELIVLASLIMGDCQCKFCAKIRQLIKEAENREQV
jgi:hypothetical protein